MVNRKPSKRVKTRKKIKRKLNMKRILIKGGALSSVVGKEKIMILANPPETLIEENAFEQYHVGVFGPSRRQFSVDNDAMGTFYVDPIKNWVYDNYGDLVVTDPILTRYVLQHAGLSGPITPYPDSTQKYTSVVYNGNTYYINPNDTQDYYTKTSDDPWNNNISKMQVTPDSILTKQLFQKAGLKIPGGRFKKCRIRKRKKRITKGGAVSSAWLHGSLPTDQQNMTLAQYNQGISDKRQKDYNDKLAWDLSSDNPINAAIKAYHPGFSWSDFGNALISGDTWRQAANTVLSLPGISQLAPEITAPVAAVVNGLATGLDVATGKQSIKDAVSPDNLLNNTIQSANMVGGKFRRKRKLMKRKRIYRRI